MKLYAQSSKSLVLAFNEGLNPMSCVKTLAWDWSSSIYWNDCPFRF